MKRPLPHSDPNICDLPEVAGTSSTTYAPPNSVEYWKRAYLEARRETKRLADALEFIRDCEDDGEEMGPIVTVGFLKEQARAILNEVNP